MKKHVLQCVYCGAVVNAVAPISSQPERSTLSARNVVLGALLILGITGAIWAFVVAEAGTQTSKPTAMTAEPAKPTQDNAPQTPQVTDNEATQTPDKAEEDKQLKLGADAMVATWQATPVAFNERENLRFDAVIVMPDNTVCLSIHDAHPFPGVEEPNALIYGGGRLYPVNDVTADLWARECVNQQGINMEPEIEDRFSQIQRQMDDLNQELHNSQPAQPGQPAPQQSAPPEPAPALSFQPSPESTDVTPAAVASRQETSGSPSQTTEVTQGQTPDQVVAILGPPISITTGTKHVYTYPHVMIVFTDGKVSEIHQIQ